MESNLLKEDTQSMWSTTQMKRYQAEIEEEIRRLGGEVRPPLRESAIQEGLF